VYKVIEDKTISIRPIRSAPFTICLERGFSKGVRLMQTFVPYPSIKKSAESLDSARLGKQRSESKIILKVLERRKRSPKEKFGWKNHPAVLMWEGHEDFLRAYSLAICLEWRKRGYKDSTMPFFLEGIKPNPKPPSWWGDERLHESHRSKLIAKFPEHYENIFTKTRKKTRKDLDYYWPTP